MNIQNMIIRILGFFIFCFFFQVCSSRYYLTIVSPGVTSDYRLKSIGGIRMLEAAYYGTWHYTQTAFYMEPENLDALLTDPNNHILNHKELFDSVSKDRSSVRILFEYCYDQTKPIQIDEDKEQYQFEWNGNEPKSKISYLYPYSYYKKGNRIRQKLPYYQSERYPKNEWKQTTGYDQYFCVRNLLEFDGSIQKKGTNELKVVTPREHLLYYEYEYNGKFIHDSEEEIN
ncbi:hypothetical protein [Leptospira levettii]|uniref:hypothetical protein n=2 Tax=Leptospira levettii TaxID=2023178 RepID=UPI0010828486|nr:hypothetical protein [Leptospira levettii]TGK97933.1 hypothetical protein EHQ34_06375 [Leptospira levettii]TGL14928.1 hypothetical protein EHQ39_00315 [Leptospira levettii]